jgi:hypothetical protein
MKTKELLKNKKRIIGKIMIVIFFTGLYVAVSLVYGWLNAALVMIIAAIMTVLITTAIDFLY